jgi:protein TonB
MVRAARLVPAAAAALAVTCGLFLLMHKLISLGGADRFERRGMAGIHFGPVDIPEQVRTRSRKKPEQPPPPEQAPPPPRMPAPARDRPTRVLPELDLPNLDLPLVGGEGLYLGDLRRLERPEEGDIIPVVVIRPQYPREAALSGIEGWVKVEFTITESGTVRNPRVVDARPPRVFNREAIRAILKWKFKPRVIDGVPVERRATQVIDFALDSPGDGP